MNLTDITKIRNKPLLTKESKDRNHHNYKKTYNNETSIFIKQINKKLTLVNLKLSDFKKGKVYDFNEATAGKLIELYDFSLGHNLNKFEKNQIKLADKKVMANYLSLVRELVESHFSDDKKEHIIRNIDAIKIDLKIYEKESLKNVADGLFEKSSDAVDATRIQEVEKLFTDIYSVKKYPYLTEMDRVSLFLELEDKLATVIEEHQAAIHKVNNYRSNVDNQDEDINEILEY